MTLEEAIIHAEEVAKRCELHMCEFPDQLAYVEKFYDAEKCAEEHRRLADWLKLLKRAKFEFDEAVRVIDHSTPDVREADRIRAYVIINTFMFLQELSGEV